MNTKIAMRMICVWSLIILFLALIVIGLFPFYPGSFYWFTIPLITQALVAFGLSSAYSLNRIPSTKMACTVFIIHLLLPATWYFAMSKWPGGNDGPGLAWYYFVGGGSLIASLLGVGSLITLKIKGMGSGTPR